MSAGGRAVGRSDGRDDAVAEIAHAPGHAPVNGASNTYGPISAIDARPAVPAPPSSWAYTSTPMNAAHSATTASR